MKNILSYLKGKRTYLLAFCAILYALIGVALNRLGQDEALKIIWEALTASALRAGIKADR